MKKQPVANCLICPLPAWWLWRGACTRSHPELGREKPQRRWYFVLRRGRVGRCQACKAQIGNAASADHRDPFFAKLTQPKCRPAFARAAFFVCGTGEVSRRCRALGMVLPLSCSRPTVRRHVGDNDLLGLQIKAVVDSQATDGVARIATILDVPVGGKPSAVPVESLTGHLSFPLRPSAPRPANIHALDDFRGVAQASVHKCNINDRQAPSNVIPAKPGIQMQILHAAEPSLLDPGFRRDDDSYCRGQRLPSSI